MTREAHEQPRAIPVRFRILGVLFVLSFVNYLLRNNMSVAIPSIQRGIQLHQRRDRLDPRQLQFQLHAAADSRRRLRGGLGPRRALDVIAVTWGVLTFLTGFAPALMAASATARWCRLIVVRFLLGATNAPMFPGHRRRYCQLVSAGRLGVAELRC